MEHDLLASTGKDAPIETNDSGGKQSATIARLDLLPPLALLQVGKVLKHGVKYGVDNWRLIRPREHLNHALIHALAWLAGDRKDDHAGHFACRAMMFLETTITERAGDQWYAKSTEQRITKPDREPDR